MALSMQSWVLLVIALIYFGLRYSLDAFLDYFWKDIVLKQIDLPTSPKRKAS